MFIAGFGCGFYVRDRIFQKQRSRSFVQPPYRQEAAVPRSPGLNRNAQISPLLPDEQDRIQAIATSQARKPNIEQETAPLTPLDFNNVRMRGELRALLELLPRERRTKHS